MWGTVHRTCLYSVKTKKIFLGCEEPRKIFLQVALALPFSCKDEGGFYAYFHPS